MSAVSVIQGTAHDDSQQQDKHHVYAAITTLGSPKTQHLHRPLTLKEVCWRTLKSHITTSNVLDLLRFARQYNFLPEVEAHCMNYICSAYSLLLQRHGREVLAEALEPGLMASLEAKQEETDAAVAARKSRVLGRVLDAPTPSITTVLFEPSVGGHPKSFSYSALVSGMHWPEEVNPQQREQFLSHAGFLQVFGMSYEQYVRLPAWKQRVLKQEHKLF